MSAKRLLNKNEDILKKWNIFVNDGSINKKGLRDVISDSWIRSKKYNIDPFAKDYSVSLGKEDLKRRYKESLVLLQIAKPFMKSLYKIVTDTDFMIRLTDKDGYVLEHIGEENLIKKYNILGFNNGYNVKEEVIGTNAIGIALITGEPIQVLGAEHYLEQYHKWTSSACPIKDKNGDLIGALGITGPYELVHPHTLGMIVAAAEAIEKELLIEYSNKRLKIMNERFYQITESISEGIMRIDNKGTILSINRFARRMLSYNEVDILGKNIEKIITSDNLPQLVKGISCGKKYEEEEIQFKTKMSRKKNCIANIMPITSMSSNDLGGMVVTFKESKAVHHLVNKMIGANAMFTFNDILGKSKVIKEVIKVATMAASTNTTVLLQGESGTGKEMFAQAIHNGSNRKANPFVFLNCGAIPRELVSSELFGYEGGAFTGAKRGGHPGKFEFADGGTIFLDEIGDMPLDTQVSLLRVLEDKKIVRVGGHNVIPINVRVIAATNKDLKKEVELGNFRRDLFYRINVMPIYTPALRNRKEDIKIFIDYFIEKFSELGSKRIKGIDYSFYNEMLNYNWPGNVRELQNVVQLVLNIAENNTILTNKNLPSYIKPKQTISESNDEPLYSLDEIEKNAIMNTIERVNGNIALASKVLGIGRSTLYRKIEKYELKELLN